MTRRTRLAIGSALILAIGCASASVVSPERRVELELFALQAACREKPRDVGSPEIRRLCELLTAPADPTPVIEDRGPSEGPTGDAG